MNRDEFCRCHWDYYAVLERDFLATERYISFDLGDNYTYQSNGVTDYGNSMAYSTEFIKQYQAICSEIDVIMKSICTEFDNNNTSKMPEYTNEILQHWTAISQQEVTMKNIKLIPFKDWTSAPNYNPPHWWKPYNDVKHERLSNMKFANLKNVLNALAGLYILESYFVKFIGDRDGDMDIPNGFSELFEMNNFKTQNTFVGGGLYLTEVSDISDIESLDI